MAAIPPYVLDGDVIDPDDWGNPVVDALIDHESRLDAYDAQTLSGRLTTVEGYVIDHENRLDAAEATIVSNTAGIAALGTRVGVSATVYATGISAGGTYTAGLFTPSYTAGMPVMETDPGTLQANSIFRLPAYDSLWAMQVYINGGVASALCDAWITLLGFGTIALETLPIGKGAFSVSTTQPFSASAGLQVMFFNGHGSSYSTNFTVNLFKVGP